MMPVQDEPINIQAFGEEANLLFERENLYDPLIQAYKGLFDLEYVVSYFYRYEDWDNIAEHLRADTSRYLAYVWKDDAFVRVKGRVYKASDDELFRLTREIHLRLRNKESLQKIYDALISEQHGKGFKFLLARAISIISNLQIPAIYSDEGIEDLATFLGIEIGTVYPTTAIRIKEYLDTHTVFKSNQVLLRYVFPKMIYDRFIRDKSKENEAGIKGKSAGSAEHKTWWLNINGGNWNFETFTPDQIGWFNIHESDGRLRYLSENFNRVKKNDFLIVFETKIVNAIVAIFKVTKELHKSERGEVIEFKVLKKLDYYINISELLNIDAFRETEFLKSDIGTIFEISPGMINALNELFSEVKEILKPEPINMGLRDFYGGYNNEKYTPFTGDRIGITPDVQAFASLIAHADVCPPLAIGLFGKWGSGKSFFMNKLREQIDEYRTDKYSGFIKNVVHIEFNAWHYADSNLWACIMNNIFDGLKKYGSENEGEDLIKKVLYEELENSRKLIAEAEEAKTLAAEELKTAKQEAKNIFHEKESLLLFLRNLVRYPVAQIVVSERDKFTDELREELNLDGSLDVLEKEVRRLNTSTGRLKKVLSKNPYTTFIIIGFILLSAGITYITGIAKLDGVFKVLAHFGQLSGLVIPITLFIKKINPHLRRLGKVAEQIGVYSNNYIRQEEDKARLKVAALEAKERQAEMKQKEASDKLIAAENELKDIKDGKKLMQFITERAGSDDYNKHLGIVSMISRDLNVLKSELKKVEGQNNKLKIERIILYIDDLDRCSEAKVIEVLEAVHLLLSTDLFVVIVGVDPRWVSHALATKYDKLLLNEFKKTEIVDRSLASTYDYLEKIFQIPFVLSPITKNGTESLIEDLLKENVATEVKKPLPEFLHSPTHGLIQEEPLDNNMQVTPHENVERERSISVLPDEEEIEQKKDEEKKEAQRVFNRVVITQEEVKFMKTIADLLGGSPRTVKRYINTYRLIRTYKEFDVEDGSLERLKLMMVLLALVTCNGDIAVAFREHLYADDVINLRDLLDKIQVKYDDSIEDDSLNGIRSFIEKDEEGISETDIAALRKVFPWISKFSFRNLDAV